MYSDYFELMVNGVSYDGAAFQNSIKELFKLDTYVIDAVVISMPINIYLKVGQFWESPWYNTVICSLYRHEVCNVWVSNRV